MSKLQFHNLFTVAASSLMIFATMSLLSSVAATKLLATQLPNHVFPAQIPEGKLFYKQSLQLIKANNVPYATAIADDSLLEAALRVPAVKLAESYQSMKKLLRLLTLAEVGVTIQTPTQTIGPHNAKEVRSELEKKLAIYETAIRQRGYKTISGKYHANATSPCERIQSMWADGISKGILGDFTISQDDFTIQLVHRFEQEGKLSNIEMPGTIVESTLTFEDLMNSDFSFVGEITPGKIIVRPDVEEILAAWPTNFGFKAPSRDDLSSCTVTLVPI